MPTSFRISSLIPVGLVVENVACFEEVIVVTACAGAREVVCPLCRTPSRRVHSCYVRQASDLPCSGRNVRLRPVTRRFVCASSLCRRRIFAERFDDTVLVERARRTTRLEHVVHHLGLALGGRPAASVATADAAGQQRHAVAGGAPQNRSTNRAAQRDRHRRLGTSSQLSLCNDRVRSQAEANCDAVA